MYLILTHKFRSSVAFSLFASLKFSPYFFSFIFITIIGENNADNTTNNHRFPVKILYDCNKPANPSPALMYDDKSNKLYFFYVLQQWF